MQGYSQEEGIDYDERFVPIVRMEEIQMLIAYSYYMGFKLYQMNVKNIFLNGYLKEEVFVH